MMPNSGNNDDDGKDKKGNTPENKSGCHLANSV